MPRVRDYQHVMINRRDVRDNLDKPGSKFCFCVLSVLLINLEPVKYRIFFTLNILGNELLNYGKFLLDLSQILF